MHIVTAYVILHNLLHQRLGNQTIPLRTDGPPGKQPSIFSENPKKAAKSTEN